MSSAPKESCGVVGIRSSREDVASRIYWSLLTLNHRGHESYGIAVLKPGGRILVERGLGLVSDLDIEKLSDWRRALKGQVGIGHVRYATSGQLSSKVDLLADAQPTVGEHLGRSLCIAFNGNITNLLQVLREFMGKAALQGGKSDIHVLLHLLVREYAESDLIDAPKLVCEKL
ncbi:MAG: amidophosphoribosyltransferase, partial [Thaumarchaeota archaeon]|nr:amidophosphoribosyltransferase [Nitrososphaerota archaeon]